MKPKLLIATNNQGKLKEIRAILGDLELELISPADLGLELDVEEDGQTYAENATKKAIAFFQASGLTSLADNSGLEVDALDGAPGLHSARYSTLPNATDADRRATLLLNLSRYPRPWTARFRATVAIAGPGSSVKLAEGTCPGEIIPEGTREGRFWLRSYFLVRTFRQNDGRTGNGRKKSPEPSRSGAAECHSYSD